MRIVFMGTPEFSVPALEALVAAGHDIAAVYTQPPRPAGRGKKDRPSAVHQKAKALGLAVFTPTSFKADEAFEIFATHQADIAVVVAYGLILPQRILDEPTHGCLNIHASLLPRWRGAAPIHRAIMAGDAETGVCIMQMEAGLDTGPMLLTRRSAITAEDTTGTLHDRLSDIGAEAIVSALADLPTLTPKPQSYEGVTYAAKIDKAEARIDWSRPGVEVDQHIRGLSPFPGAWFEVGGTRIKALRSEYVAEVNALAGQVSDAALIIACGTGGVRLTHLQRAGKAVQDAETFLRGFPLPSGTQTNEV